MLELQDVQLHQHILSARQAERKQVARELHDQIIQALIGLNYHLSDIRARPGPDINAQLTQLQSELRGVVSHVRDICANLRPPPLDLVGLIASIRSWAHDLEQSSPFRIALRIDGDVQQHIHPETALCLLRVLQESLINAQKHAHARRVNVQLRIRPNDMVLTVRDDGAGFVVPDALEQEIERQHFGLVGMRERVELVGGRLRITSTPGRGTSIHAQVPCHLEVHARALPVEVRL